MSYVCIMNKQAFWNNMGAAQAPEHATHLGECLVWQRGIQRGGYGVVWIDGVQWYAHRFAYTEKIGSIPSDMCIDHLCRNKACCNVAHMEVTTIEENSRRASEHRPMERNGRPRADWASIRADRASGATYMQLAAKYKMSVSGIYLACNKP